MLSTFAHRLLLVLALASTLAAPAAAQSAKPDFSGWQILLDRYAMRLGGKGQPLDTRFDYEQLFVDEDVWHTGQSQRLMAILPNPPLTPDQVELLKRDNVVSTGALTLAMLGITPTAVEAILPSYLDRFRKGGWYERRRSPPTRAD